MAFMVGGVKYGYRGAGPVKNIISLIEAINKIDQIQYQYRRTKKSFTHKQ
jgi:hypothetical protein